MNYNATCREDYLVAHPEITDYSYSHTDSEGYDWYNYNDPSDAASDSGDYSLDVTQKEDSKATPWLWIGLGGALLFILILLFLATRKRK